ncbi:MAG: 50S ribosomal protein L1 [Planctomycetia bacterium]|nr:50S ribosomal protein L1 [Planctomycetia bacterium]
MAKQSKRFRSLQAVHSDKTPVEVEKAVSILKQFGTTKFDQTVEMALRLGIDPKQADQLVRGSVVLPHGIGKSLRVAVFAKGDKVDEAKAAGADTVGGDDLAKKVKEGWMDFDVCIAAPDMMGVVGPLGKVLGPKGLMPSPRAGTVTPDIAKAVKEYKAGKVEFRNDAGGIVHAVVGKMSFSPEKLVENIRALLDFIRNLKPSSVKGQYIKSAALSASMSPSVRIVA